MVFDINDFDETLPGPWEWDVKRLAASFEVAGRNRGFTDEERREINLTVVRGYRERMLQAAESARARRLVRPARHRPVHGVPRRGEASGSSSAGSR